MNNDCLDDSMMTPKGPPSPLAYIIPVADDIVGLIIGKGGETIRQLQLESGAKIQVALKANVETGMRNVFVEGPDDKYRKAKEMLDEIVRVQKHTSNPQTHCAVADVNPFVSLLNKDKIFKFDIPDKMTGLVIGKGGDTLKGIAQQSNTKIFIPKTASSASAVTRQVEVIGSEIE